ncbi:MAG: GAF domain-containing SpoIIE family protein phosphatase [Aeromicrobium sp.]
MKSVTVTFGPMELARRASLDGLRILDTPPEERYDRITRLARLNFDMMLSTFTLIDRDRAWTKSAAGASRSESPREASFCTHTVLDDAPIVVADVTMDHRFADLPAVRGPLGIRFYAGFPVHDSHGTAIGTLCLYDDRPRTLDQAGLAVMTELTSWVETELVAPEESDQPRAVRLAPVRLDAPEIPGFDAAAFCHSTTGHDGDYFDHQRQGNVHAFAVAGIIGKGSATGTFMATARQALHAENRALASGRLGRTGDLGEVLTTVNSLLLDDLSSSASFMTGFFGWADPDSGTIRYVDAGHGLSVVVRADGSAEHLHTTDLPLGVTNAWRWTEHSVILRPGDDLVCFSGGLVKLLGGPLQAIPAISQLVEDADDPRQVVDDVKRLAATTTHQDDVTVLALRRTA